MTAPRRFRRIVATTDVHSAFDDAVPMLARLHAARRDSFVVDCGDFFEGTGYYRLGQGRIEQDVLVRLYDAVVPGNHGWVHHFEPGLHDITVCANAIDDETGEPLFRPIRLVRVGSRRVAVTGIIGQQAFNAIPADQRAGHRVSEPVRALRELMLAHHHQADSWVVLSHSGFDEDLKLAAACPFLDVVFAGHCHSERPEPVPVGDTLVLKGENSRPGTRWPNPWASAGPRRWDPSRPRPSSLTSWLPYGRPSTPSARNCALRSARSGFRTGTVRSTVAPCSPTSPTASTTAWAPKPCY